MALQAGVSKTTVSYIINGKGTFPEETRKRVMDACAALHYQPDPTARYLPSLRRRSAERAGSGLLGFSLIAHDASQLPVYMTFIVGAIESAAYHDKRVVCEVMKKDLQASDFLINRFGLDGRLLVGIVDDEVVDALGTAGIPLVVLGFHSCKKDVWTVIFDYRAAGRLAVEYLFGLGHRRILFLEKYDPEGTSFGYVELVKSGFQEALLQRQLSPERSLLRFNLASEELEALLRSKDRPTAIVAQEDAAAAQAHESAARLSLRIPTDLSLLTIVSKELQMSRPTTLIDTRGQEIGRQGAELVLRLIDSPQLTPGQVLIKPEVSAQTLSCCAPPPA